MAPAIMPGWDGFDVRDGRDLLYVKISTGIGSGLITGGRVHRGDAQLQ